MKKIPTVFVRSTIDHRHVTRELAPGCEWVADGEGVPTLKWDGTCVMRDADDQWWARREVKPGKPAPPDWQEVNNDQVTGKRMGWEPIKQSGYRAALEEATAQDGKCGTPGTYELIGPKINGNPHRITTHQLRRHGDHILPIVTSTDNFYDAMWQYLEAANRDQYVEGVVWHHPDGQMAKIKAKDFPQ